MIGAVGKLSIPEFDGESWSKSLDREMGLILRGAVKEWIRTVLKVIRGAPHTVGDSFPIQTGRAKASLRPIARYVRVALPIRPAPGRPNLISVGESSAQFNIQDDKTAPKSFQYRFEWETSLEHFLINEFNRMPRVPSSPWYATVAANKAARIYIRQEVKKRLKKFHPKYYIRTKV